MSDKREIGFDILENSDIETVEKLERDIPVISEKDRNRILEMSLKKFESGRNRNIADDNENENGNIEEIIVNTEDEEVIVSGVEKYSKPKMSKAVAAFIGVAAAFAIVCAGIWGFPKSNDNNDISQPIQKETSTSPSESTTASSYNAAPSAEFLEELRDNIAANIPNLRNYVPIDVNQDGISEFFVNYMSNDGNYYTDFYYFNGTDYVQEIVINPHTGIDFDSDIIRGRISCNIPNNFIWCEYPEGKGNVVYRMHEDSRFEIIGIFDDDDEFFTEVEWTELSLKNPGVTKTWTEDNIPTQETLDDARYELVDTRFGGYYEIVPRYAYCDVNMDGVSELVLEIDDQLGRVRYTLFYYNGIEYTSEIYQSGGITSETLPTALMGDAIMYLPEENLVRCILLSDGSDMVLRMLEDNSFEKVSLAKDLPDYKEMDWLELEFISFEDELVDVDSEEWPDEIKEFLDNIAPEAYDAMNRLTNGITVRKDYQVVCHMYSVNADNAPEIIASYIDENGKTVSDFYYFNGTDYVNKLVFTPDTENAFTTDIIHDHGTDNVNHEIITSDTENTFRADIIHGEIRCSVEEGLVWCKYSGGENVVYKMHNDNTFEIIGIFVDGDEFFDSKKWDSFPYEQVQHISISSSTRPLKIHKDASKRLLEDLSSNKYCPVVGYSYFDVNEDEVPEFVVSFKNMSGNEFSNLYYFNGTDYINAVGETEEGTVTQITGRLTFFPYQDLIRCQFDDVRNAIYEMNEDNTFELKAAFNENESYDDDTMLGSARDYYIKVRWIDVMYTPYE